MLGRRSLNLPLEFDRYLGTLSLPQVSLDGQKKISRKTVAVIGVGGTGGIAAELLVRSGIARLIIVDDDSVSMTNLQRQVEYTERDIGKPKVEVLKTRLASVNSSVQISPVNERVSHENINFLGKPDLIFDGTDNYSARNAINRFSVDNGIPWIMTAANETIGTLKAIIPHVTSCTSCLGYPESGNEEIGCAQTGILPSTPVVIGSMAVSVALKILMGEEVDGDVIYVDTWKHDIERIRTGMNPECKVCGTN